MAKHTIRSGKRPANPKPARIGDNPAATSAAPQTINLESRKANNMNMMSEIVVPQANSYNEKVGARLPMFPSGISDGLRSLIERWRNQLLAIDRADKQEDVDAAVGVRQSIQCEIEDFPAVSMGDIAAKLAIAAFAINGAETNTQTGITDDDHLLIFAEPEHSDAENIYITAAEDAARLAEEHARPTFAPSEEFGKALAAFEAAHANANATNEDDEIDRLGDTETAAVQALLKIPSPDFRAVAEKLRSFLATYATSHDDILASILEDMDRLSVAENPALVNAFESFRTTFGLLKAADANADTDPFYQIMDPADEIMVDTPATTPTGAAMKLKRAFVALAGEDWSDYAVFNDRPATFAEGIRLSDLYQRMMWSAIEDLDRMGATGEARLGNFATAWLKRWTGHGGSIFVPRGEREGSFGFPAEAPALQSHLDRLVRGEHETDQAWEDRQSRLREWLDGNYTGRMRELLDLLESVPGGPEAVKSIVRSDPKAGMPSRAED